MSLSKYNVWEAPAYNQRGREIHFLNAIENIHDTFCGCDDTRLHLLACMFFPAGVEDDSVLQTCVEKLKAKPKKCRRTEDLDSAATIQASEEGPDILDHVTAEDLENLFSEDTAGTSADAAG
mgnify:CR=1 FL=1